MQIETVTGTIRELATTKLDELDARLQGPLVLPDHEDYEQVRQVWNGMIDRRPAFIVRCMTAEDVVAAVNFVRQHSLRLSVRGGGHNVAGKSVLDGAMLIDLSLMRGVSIDPDNQRVRVEGGALLDDLNVEAQKYGLAVPTGVVSETGVAGLTLHGGYGWLSRKFGITIDNLASVEIVTADGKLTHADAHTNADLFWAVRGGGGNFGVVTVFEFQAHPIEPQMWLAAPTYPASQRKEVLARFANFMGQAPHELSGLASLWNAPDDPEVPAEIRGKPVITTVGCYYGSVDKGKEVTKPLYELGSSPVDFGGQMPFVEINRFFDDDYPDGHFYYWKAAYLDRIDDEVLEILADFHDRRPSPLSNTDIWFFGGAISQVAPDDTAYPQRYTPFMASVEANWTDPDQSQANIAWARQQFEALQKHSPGGLYLNFPGFAEEEHDIEDIYATNFERLSRIKAKYDPDNLFRGTFNIPPRGGGE